MGKKLSLAAINDYISLIKSGRFTVAVIGMGYVGLPLAVEFANKGVLCYGFDVNDEKINLLRNGISYIDDVQSSSIKECISKNLLVPSGNFSELSKCNAIFICVPTPFTANKDPDISYILSAAESIKNNLKKNQIIILKSTTFPGTTEKHLKPILETTGLKAGQDFFLAYSPERIDPGNKKFNTSNTTIIVGGITKNCTKLAVAVSEVVVVDVKPVSNPAVAELSKLLENIFRSVNIALVNELAQLCDRIGINVWEVIEAASTKPFGYMSFYPGPGIGGHCILIDPYYLAWMAREYDFVTNFVTLAAEINEDMPYYVSSMVVKEISKQIVPLNKAKVLILGVAFKRDVSDLRHSPALKVAEILIETGINFIEYYDPYIPEIKVKNTIIKSLKSINQRLLRKYNVVIITTDHSVFDFQMIADNCNILIDTRNACKNVKGNKKNIVLLGDGKN